jgi:hypothetical protein
MRDAARLVELYDRVHAELEEGKPWVNIDHGLSSDGWTYESWLAYMDQRLHTALKSILFAAGFMKRRF